MEVVSGLDEGGYVMVTLVEGDAVVAIPSIEDSFLQCGMAQSGLGGMGIGCDMSCR